MTNRMMISDAIHYLDNVAFDFAADPILFAGVMDAQKILAVAGKQMFSEDQAARDAMHSRMTVEQFWAL